MSLCVECKEPLTIEITDDHEDSDTEMGEGAASSSAAGPSTGITTVPDDVLLSCGCHFHWTCLLNAYTITDCPSCNTPISQTDPNTGGPQVLVTLTNEGGVQESLDILPLLSEESYLKAYPEERRARALLELCREGDLDGVISILQDTDSEEEDSDDDEDVHAKQLSVDELLRYQDPLAENQSALHCAVQGGSREIAWLLLLLASKLDLLEFPALVFQEAESRGIMRGDVEDKVDIRSLRDLNGKSAEDLAREIGGVWVGWEGTGRLSI